MIKENEIIKFTLLGTGTSQGVPVIGCKCNTCISKDSKDNRSRSSLLVSYSDTNIVVDTGPDFRFQMLRENVLSLDAVLLTHDHHDHVAGLDDVRAFNFIQKKSMPVYSNNNTFENIKRYYYYAFEDYEYPGLPKFNLIQVDSDAFYINNHKIIPVKAFHSKMPILGFRFNNLTYLTDISFIEEQEKEKILGSQVLIVSAPRKKKHNAHFNLYEAIDFSKELKIPQTYVTHIGHSMGRYEEVQKELPDNVSLAYDGLKLITHL